MATTGARGSRGGKKTREPAAIIPETLTRKGFRIRGLGPLPERFDPMKATARQLAAYRLPRRPDAKTEPRLRALWDRRSEEHTSELQSHVNLVCRLLLEKKKNIQ